MRQQEKITDDLETMIIMALDANHKYKSCGISRVADDGSTWDLHDQGEILTFDAMKPQSAFTFDMQGNDRIFAGSKEYLLDHPAEVIGDSLEVMMLLPDGRLKWQGFRLLPKKPKRVACLGKASHWYELHHRLIYPNGQGQYVKRVVPINKNGDALLAKIDGHFVCVPNIEGQHLYIAASMLEDARRTNAMLAEVKGDTGIKFPVPLDDYQSIFSSREGPMIGDRRKAIIHWVAKHLRRSSKGNTHEVKRHVRGVDEINIDGLRIKITPNA